MCVLPKDPEMLSCWRPSEATQAGHQLSSQPCRASLWPCLHRALYYPSGSLLGGPGHTGIRCGFLIEGAGESFGKALLVIVLENLGEQHASFLSTSQLSLKRETRTC